MFRKEIITILVVIVLSFAGVARADIVELDLFSIGCPTEFNWDTQYWQTDFDLGIEFVEIDSVYMDWSGEITAGLAILYDNPDEPFPKEVGIGASLGGSPYPRFARIFGGEATYPVPEPFDCLSEFELLGTTTWLDLLDGQGATLIQYKEYVIVDGYYIEHGFINLDRAILRVEGVIVPEPATVLLLTMGIMSIQLKRRSK